MKLHGIAVITGILLVCLCTPAFAQFPKSAYFMDNLPTRNKLNPAYQPERGYFNIPVIGALGVSVTSNALSVQDFTDIADNETSFLFNDKFMRHLKDDNRINFDFNTDIISFGFYSGKGFWTVNLGVRGMVNSSLPKSMFEFARDADELDIEHIRDYDIRNMKIYSDVYGELALGYSRPINERLTVGGKFKVLLGGANVNMNIEHLQVKSNGESFDVLGKGDMNIAMKGLDIIDDTDNETGNEYVSDFDFDSPGISGFGVGFDLGATYKLLDNLTLSAAILDLGFIKWGKSSTSTLNMNQQHTFDPYNFSGDDADLDFNGDGVVDDSDLEYYQKGSVDILDLDLFQFQKGTPKSYTTTLRSTLNIGAEYSILNDKIGFGLLSSTHFILPKAITELTASANFRPVRWFEGTISYSFIQSNFKTFGLGLKFGPLFIGTDYMITRSFKNLQTASGYLGISIPLGKRKPFES